MSTDTWTSKKFVLSILVFLVGTLFVFLGKANFDQWKGMIEWVLVTYLGANVAEGGLNKLSPDGK